MNIDAATAILAARGTFSGASGARRHHWTSAAVRQTLLTIVPQLWRLHGLGPVPPLADSMRTYLCFLDTCGLLSPHSESIVDLLDATTVRRHQRTTKGRPDGAGASGPGRSAGRRLGSGQAEVVEDHLGRVDVGHELIAVGPTLDGSQFQLGLPVAPDVAGHRPLGLLDDLGLRVAVLFDRPSS